MQLLHRYLIAIAAMACAQPLLAQEDAPPAQLNDQFEATDYYAEQERAAWRTNAEKLAEIDKAYSDAMGELSRENARRLQAIFKSNSDARKQLAEQGAQSEDRATESKRLQTQSDQERAELSAWYEQTRREISAVHVGKRAAQIAATNELVDRIGAQRVATLQRVLSGPVPVATLPVMTFPEEPTATSGVTEDNSSGPPVSTGGIDLGGTVPVDSPGDELMANENAERFALYERLFHEKQERRRRAEEQAASQQTYIQTAQARANTAASAASQRRPPDCENNPDADWDGVRDARCGGADCDDNNPDRYPGNTEVGNDVDEDCDPNTLGDDGDGDGFISALFCNGDRCGRDCDDTKYGVHPGAIESCNFVDDDCDADVDEGVTGLKFLDRDGDLHGDPDDSLLVCAQTGSYTGGDGSFNWLSTVGNDCDDTDPAIWQGCGQQ